MLMLDPPGRMLMLDPPGRMLMLDQLVAYDYTDCLLRYTVSVLFQTKKRDTTRVIYKFIKN